MNASVLKLRDVFQTNHEKIFVVDAIHKRSFSYGNLESLSLKMADAFRRREICKGDKIFIVLPNCIEFIIVYFACMHVGAVAVPVNERLHTKEIDVLRKNVNPKLIVTSKELHKLLGVLVSKNVLVLDPNDKKASDNYLNELDAGENCVHEPFDGICDEDLCLIIFTSGTTGIPKGIQKTYSEIIGNGMMFVEILGLSMDMRFYAWLPLSYLGGFYNLMMIPLLSGGGIYLDHVFSPKTIVGLWQRMEEFEINALWFVPSIISMLLMFDRSPEGADYCGQNLKMAIVGTAPLPWDHKEKFEKRYLTRLYENYGLSETLFISTNSPQTGVNKGVGKILPGCKVSVLDDEGNAVPQGKEGEIAVESAYRLRGYYDSSASSSVNVQGETFPTGDIGYLDKEGYLFVTDRKKDLIIKGGVNISPREIEEVLMRHPKINKAAVFGVAHPLAGEEVIAVVDAGGLSEIDVKKHCQESIAMYKIPQRVIFMSDFPVGVTGKINKKALRFMTSKGIGNE